MAASNAGVPDPIALGRGVPPPECIPAEEIRRCTQDVLEAAAQRVFQYAPLGGNPGDADLRSQLGIFHDVDPQHFFVGNGSLQVLDLVTQLLCGNAPFEALVEMPSYDRSLRIFERHGGRLIGVPMQSDGLDIEALQQRLRSHRPLFLYTIPDFQNPTGATLALSKRRALVDLAREHGFTIVEDIPYRELRYAGSTLPTLRQLAAGGRVITVGSLSKILSPGLRIGYAIADAPAAVALAHLAENTYLSAPPLCQAIAARCFAEGVVQANVLRARALLRPRHDAAARVAREVLGDRVFTVPHGGYFMAALLPTRRPEASLLAAAAARGVHLAAGAAFYPAAQPPQGRFFLRIPFQALAPAELAHGLAVVHELADGEEHG